MLYPHMMGFSETRNPVHAIDFASQTQIIEIKYERRSDIYGQVLEIQAWNIHFGPLRYNMWLYSWPKFLNSVQSVLDRSDD